MRSLSLAVFLALVVTRCPADAGFVEMAGGQITLDDATNIEWLDLSFTVGKSRSQVDTDLAGVGYLGRTDWRWATLSDIDTLRANAGYTIVHNSIGNFLASGGTDLTPLIGNGTFAYGYYEGSPSEYVGIVNLHTTNDIFYRWVNYQHDPSRTYTLSSSYGHFLIRDFAVPEPTSIALLGMGGLSFLGYRLRRRRRELVA